MLRGATVAVSGMATAVLISGLAFAGTAYAAPPPAPHHDLGKRFNTPQQCQAEARQEHRAIDCRFGPDKRYHLWG